MNLHIMAEEKVVSRTIQYFEDALPGQNKYLIISSKRSNDIENRRNLPNTMYATYGSEEFWAFIGNSSTYKNIIIHFLSKNGISFVNSVKNPNNLVWVVWGGDLYNALLEPYGYKLYAYSNVYRGRFWKVIPWFYFLRNKYLARIRLQAIKKIPRMAMVACDYSVLKSYFPELNPELLDFFYYPVNDMVDKNLLNRNIESNNIFVGNSSQQTNNHRMVFEILSRCNIGNRKIIAPLSYGCSYGRNDAIRWGKKLLGDNFKPITKFMPLEEYNKLMLSASIFVYGHFRQEAFGNIVVSLYIGGIVVLDDRNPLLKFFKNIGFIIFSMEELPKLVNYTMKEEDVRKNKILINTLYSKEKLLSSIQKLFG